MTQDKQAITPATDTAKKDSASDARLEIWLKKLPKNPLPINLTIANQISRLLLENDCDSTKLAKLIRQDPILCLKLFSFTENVLKEREGEIQHIVHMIGLIGLNKIEHIINNSRKYHNQRLNEGFHEILSASFFASHISPLILKRYEGNHDRFFLPTLFFNSPLWFMWIAAPKTMEHSQRLASRKQQSYVALSVKKLGFKLPDLLSQAHKFVHLPDTTHKALAINPTKDKHFWAKVHRLSDEKLKQWFTHDKQAREHFHSIEMGIYLVNQYAIAVYLDWNGKYIQRYQDLLSRYLHIEKEEFQQLVFALTENIDCPIQYKKTLSPLYRLKGLHKEPVEIDHKKNIPSPSSDKHTTQKTLAQWCEIIHKSKNVKNAIDNTLAAMTQGIGAEHCIILEMDEEDIHTEACYGFKQESSINRFHYDWKKNNNIFKKLSEKPACLKLSNGDISKASKSFPQEFTAYCDLQPCALLSIFDHKKPKAIIYCDHKDWNNEKHLLFKQVGKTLSKTLQQLH